MLQSQREVSDLQKLNGDDALLADEDKQQVRAEKHVIQDLMRLNRSGTNAPLLFLEAQSRGNFLSPTTEVGRDIVGLLALLARVESNLLNRHGSAYDTTLSQSNLSSAVYREGFRLSPGGLDLCFVLLVSHRRQLLERRILSLKC